MNLSVPVVPSVEPSVGVHQAGLRMIRQQSVSFPEVVNQKVCLAGSISEMPPTLGATFTLHPIRASGNSRARRVQRVSLAKRALSDLESALAAPVFRREHSAARSVWGLSAYPTIRLSVSSTSRPAVSDYLVILLSFTILIMCTAQMQYSGLLVRISVLNFLT